MTDPPMDDQLPTLAPSERVGDAERDRAVDAIADHYAAGRVDRGELDARIGAAYRATTVAQLRALFADLPATPFPLSRSERRAVARSTRAPWRFPVPVVPVVFLTLAIALLVLTRGAFVFPLVWVWFAFGRRGWHHSRGWR
jgi:Domain of unknown function (DUF1707)